MIVSFGIEPLGSGIVRSSEETIRDTKLKDVENEQEAFYEISRFMDVNNFYTNTTIVASFGQFEGAAYPNPASKQIYLKNDRRGRGFSFYIRCNSHPTIDFEEEESKYRKYFQENNITEEDFKLKESKHWGKGCPVKAYPWSDTVYVWPIDMVRNYYKDLENRMKREER